MGLRTFVLTLGLGALAMYLLDPESGQRRQERLIERLEGLGDMVGLRGAVTLTGGYAPGDILADRIRMALGRVVTHPRRLRVEVEDGEVTLAGPILADDVERAVAAVEGVPGVRAVVNDLTVLSEADHPALQG